jgi:hypothetical protein
LSRRWQSQRRAKPARSLTLTLSGVEAVCTSHTTERAGIADLLWDYEVRLSRAWVRRHAETNPAREAEIDPIENWKK